MAKPTKRTKEIDDALIEWLEQGRPLRAFCRQPGMPSRRTIDDWRAADPELSARVARAREDGFAELAEQVLEIADDGTNDTYVDDEGNVRVDKDVVARSKIRIDARLKLLACWDPSRYGSKVQVGGAADLPPLVKDATDIEIAARIEQIMSAARARRAQEKTDHGNEQGDQGARRRRPHAARRKAKGQ